MKVSHKIRGIWITLALTLLCLTSFGQGFTVLQFGLSNAPFWQNPSTNRVIRLQPIQPFIGNYQWVTSDVTGNAYYSNSSAATYSGLIMAPPSPSLNFNITVTATNLGLINVSNLISIPGNAIQTIPAGSAAWPIYVSDSRYAFNSNAASGGNAPLSANQSTNLVASAIPTNLWSNTTNGWISGLVTLLGVNTNVYIAGARINMTSNGPVVTIAVNTNQFIFSNDLWTASNFLANNAGITLTTATNITQGILTLSNANVVYTNSLYGLTNLMNTYSNSDLATYAISNGPTVAGPLVVVAPASKGIIASNATGGANFYFSTGSPQNQWFFQLMGYNGVTPTMGSNWIYAPFISGDGGGGPVFGQLTNTGASLLQSNALNQVTNVVNGTAVTTTGFTNGFGTNDYTFSKVGQQFFTPTNFDIKGGSNANYLLLTGGSNYFQTNVVFNQNGLSTNEVTTNTTLNGNTSFAGATNFIWSTNLIGFGLAGTSALTNAVFEWQSAMNLYSNWYNGYIITNNGSVWQVYTTAGGTLIATSPNLGVQTWTVNSGPTTPPTVSCWGHYEYGDRAKQIGIWSFTNVVQVIGTSNGLSIANLTGHGTNTYLTNAVLEWNNPDPGLNFAQNQGSIFNFQNASWGQAATNIGSGFGAAILSGATNKILLSGGSVIAGGVWNLISGGFNNGNSLVGGESNQISGGNDGNFIGGGIQNNIQGADSVIAGGYLNYIGASLNYSGIVSGAYNTNTQGYSFIGGGTNNQVQSLAGAVLGGLNNQVINSGNFSVNQGDVILGGRNNLVSNASWSMVGGQNVLATNKNDFVWSDGTPVNTITNSQIILEATNGVAINTNNAGTNALNVNGSVNSSSGFFVNGQPVQTAGNFVAQQAGNSTNQTVVTSPYVQGTNFVIGQNTNLFGSTNIIRIYQAGTGFVTNGAYEWNSGMGVFSNSVTSAIISNNAVAPFILITNGFTLYSSATLINTAWSSVGVGVVGTASSQYGAYIQHNGVVDIGFVTSTNIDSKIISSVDSASNSIIAQLRSTNTFMTPVSGVTVQGDLLIQDVRSNLLKDSLVPLSSVITNGNAGPLILNGIFSNTAPAIFSGPVTNNGIYYGNAAGLTNYNGSNLVGTVVANRSSSAYTATNSPDSVQVGNRVQSFGYLSPFYPNNMAQANLANVVAAVASPNPFNSAGTFRNAGVSFTSGGVISVAPSATTNGAVLRALVLNGGQNLHATVLLNLTNLYPGGAYVGGISTNISAINNSSANVLSTNVVYAVGLEATNGTWNAFHFTNGVYPGSVAGAYGLNVVMTNVTCAVDISGDSSNLSLCIENLGNSNRIYSYMPWAEMTSPTLTISNLLCGLFFGTNSGTLVAVSLRTNSQPVVSSGNGIDQTMEFLRWTQTSHNSTNSLYGGDRIQIVVPPTYDAQTNPANAIFYIHGNTGTAHEVFEQIPAFTSLTTNNPYLYFETMVSNNFIIVSMEDDDIYTGRADTWGTSNSLLMLDTARAYIHSQYAVNNDFLFGSSAGFATVMTYAAQHPGQIAGVIGNHPLFSILTQWNGGQSNDIAQAYGIAVAGSPTNTFQPTDPGQISSNFWFGLPIRIDANVNDTAVIKSAHTDVLVKEMGGVPGQTLLNTPLSPEISDYAWNGPAGHELVYPPEVITNDLAFMRRCMVYGAVHQYANRTGVFNNTTDFTLLSINTIYTNLNQNMDLDVDEVINSDASHIGALGFFVDTNGSTGWNLFRTNSDATTIAGNMTKSFHMTVLPNWSYVITNLDASGISTPSKVVFTERCYR